MTIQNSLNSPLAGSVSQGISIDTMYPVEINSPGITIMTPFHNYYLTNAHTFKLPLSAKRGDKFTVTTTNGSFNIIITLENTGTQQILFHPTSGPDTGTTIQTTSVFASVTMICTLDGLNFQVLSTNGTEITMT